MLSMLNYAIMLNYARRLARGGGAASGPPRSHQVAAPVWPNEAKKNAQTSRAGFELTPILRSSTELPMDQATRS